MRNFYSDFIWGKDNSKWNKNLADVAVFDRALE